MGRRQVFIASLLLAARHPRPSSLPGRDEVRGVVWLHTFEEDAEGDVSAEAVMSSEPSPLVPPELERDMFEAAAETIPRLFLVSRRVCEWIEEIKHRIVITAEELSPCLFHALKQVIQSNLKPASFFQKHVRHVLPLLNKMDLSRPTFTFLTHLNVLDYVAAHDTTQLYRWLSFLALLPVLTHLSIHHGLAVASSLLASCKNLEVLVCLGFPGSEDMFFDNNHLICMAVKNMGNYEEDWVTGAREGVDFGAHADAFVAKRRHEEIALSEPPPHSLFSF
ncbi:hypothetical protein B0H19DRAFT_1068129 [Mycena capillaripes]|nr:hypothetical protein B0H19DRAFT_1068129 [Mycena capillaripes]